MNNFNSLQVFLAVDGYYTAKSCQSVRRSTRKVPALASARGDPRVGSGP
jgi:hypothetical protein